MNKVNKLTVFGKHLDDTSSDVGGLRIPLHLSVTAVIRVSTAPKLSRQRRTSKSENILRT
jgi:hypothetical protein